MLVGPELVTNGDFALWDSVGARVEDPTGWTVTGEVTTDPEVSEVGTGESHGGTGTGMCNLYASDNTPVLLQQELAVIIGRKYRVSINVDTVITGEMIVFDAQHAMWSKILDSIGVYSWVFVATHTNPYFRIAKRGGVVGVDITFDNISVKEELPIELSRTGQRFSSFPEN